MLPDYVGGVYWGGEEYLKIRNKRINDRKAEIWTVYHQDGEHKKTVSISLSERLTETV